MTLMIVLPAELALEIAGYTTEYSRLEPRQTAAGEWVLPARILTAPEHASAWSRLAGLPVREMTEADFPPDPDPDDPPE